LLYNAEKAIQLLNDPEITSKEGHAARRGGGGGRRGAPGHADPRL
jgi:hypothetical protein